MKKRGKGAAAQIRRNQVLIEKQAGAKVKNMAEELGVHKRTIQRDLLALREEYSKLNRNDWEEMRAAQMKVLELMETSLIEGKVEPKVADSWRAIRSDMSKLLGLDAPAKTLHVNVDAGEKLGGYRRFVAETRTLDELQMEKVYEFARELASVTVKKPVTAFFPPEETDEAD